MPIITTVPSISKVPGRLMQELIETWCLRRKAYIFGASPFMYKPPRPLPADLQTTQSAMALPLPPGLTPMEVAFLCEMEMVTVIPRQKLESLNLLGVSSTPPTPPSLLCLYQLTSPYTGPNATSAPATQNSITTVAGTSLETSATSQHPPSALDPPFLSRAHP
jgi:hypothetical protein